MKQTHSLRCIFIPILALFIYSAGLTQGTIKEDTVIGQQIYDYGQKAYEYFKVNINLDSAEHYYKKAIYLAYNSSTYVIDERVAINLVSLASLYRNIYNNNEALLKLNEAEKILNENDPKSIHFGGLYHNKGNIYKVQNDLYRTKEYYEYSIDFLIKNGYQNLSEFAFVYSNYIKLLLELEEYELAEQKLSMIDINKSKVSPLIEFRIYNTNATSYAQVGKYDLAVFYFEKTLKVLENNPNIIDYTRDVLTYYYNIIGFHMLYEEFDQAMMECDNAYMFIESLSPYATRTKIVFRSDISYRSATIQFRQGNLDRSLWIINDNIEILNKFLEDLSPDVSIQAETNMLTTALPDLYVLKSRVLFEQFKKFNEFDDLVLCYEAYQEAIKTLNYMKLAMSNENSKLFATSQILEVYNEAVYIGKMLYDMTGENQYLEQSFEFTETSKSFALFSEIKDVEAMQFSDLPEDIKNKESRLMGEIQAYEGVLYEEQMETYPDSSKIESYKETLFHLKDDYNDLKQEIEQNYAKYYELKYNPKFVSIAEVQDKLAYRDALIEYVLSDTLLITYVIDKKGVDVFSQEIGPEFANECLEYYMLLHDQNFSGGVHENYRKFVTLGHKLYKVLIEPCLQYTDRKNFTIVPDGAITYIPFESLMTQEAGPEYINYMNLPYLIKELSVGYSHSSTLLFSERYKTKSTEDKVLAFAPMYENPLFGTDTAQFRQVLEGSDYLFPLVGTIKEVQSINETVPSKVFINEQATESNFKKYASDYSVLHLAMHTIMKDDNPLSSLLAFTNVGSDDNYIVESGDTIYQDNKLYAYEIYNLKLNAQMAVLSSCNSGFGKMQKGEGMMSLARGFIYAGCPSIVMTLWQVADKSSSELMTSFYKYLKKGKSKQEAMRLAKIDYLETSDDLTSNPYFWSGFVVLGDSSPIYRKSGLAYWMIVITVFVGILVFFQYRRSSAGKS